MDDGAKLPRIEGQINGWPLTRVEADARDGNVSRQMHYILGLNTKLAAAICIVGLQVHLWLYWRSWGMEAGEICGAGTEKRHMIICGRDFTRKSLWQVQILLLFAYDPRTLTLHEDQYANTRESGGMPTNCFCMQPKNRREAMRNVSRRKMH